jgi:dihydrofolate synthase/folylpolyglutamate synthase
MPDKQAGQPSGQTTTSGAARAAHALDRLARLHPKLIDLGLDRSLDLLGRLGNPHQQLPPVIHVAGTNGKGSVIAILRAIAEAAGLKVHVYISPHLCRFNERIRLAGQLIDNAALADLLEEVETINGDRPVTFFEVTTAAAMLAFSRIPADLLLLETGLGGALDSTNVITAPAATIITPIARDHEHFLGADLAGIAAQKAGIMRQGCPCFSAAQDLVVTTALDTAATKIGAPLIMAGRAFSITTTAGGGFCLDQNGQRLTLPAPALPGSHQCHNAGLAIIALQQVLAACGHAFDEAVIKTGLKQAVWPGRAQHIATGRLPERWPHQPIWLDGAHNAHGAAALAATLQSIHSGRWNIICGALNTRDPAEFLAPLLDCAGQVRCLTIPGQEASLDCEDLAKVARGLGLDAVAAPNLATAFDRLDQDAPVIICGSLYLAGHILLENETPPD